MLAINCKSAVPLSDAGLGMSGCAIAAHPRPTFGTCAGCKLRVPRVDGPVQIEVCRNCHGPHATKACPLPRDFDVEEERRSAKAGGCCGSPAKD